MKALVISVATMVVLLSPSFAADDLPEPPMWPHETASSSGTRIQFGVEGGYNDTTVNGDSGDAVTLKGSIIENQEVRNGAIGAFARITQYNESFFVGLQVGATYDDSNVHSQVRIDGPIPAQHINVSHQVDTDIVVDGLIRVGIESDTFRPYVGGGISAMRAKSALNYSLINTADGSLAGQAQDSDEKWLLGYKLVTGVEIPVGDLGMVAHVEGFYADYEKGKFSHDSGTLGGGKKRTTVDPEQWGVRIGAAMEF